MEGQNKQYTTSKYENHQVKIYMILNCFWMDDWICMAWTINRGNSRGFGGRALPSQPTPHNIVSLFGSLGWKIAQQMPWRRLFRILTQLMLMSTNKRQSFSMQMCCFASVCVWRCVFACVFSPCYPRLCKAGLSICASCRITRGQWTLIKVKMLCDMPPSNLMLQSAAFIL